MNRFPGAAVGIAFLLGSTALHAQTRMTQEITDEPVATTTTQSPNGIVITRWPLQTLPPDAGDAIAAPVTVAPAAPASVVVEEDVDVAEPTESVREHRVAHSRSSRLETRTSVARSTRRVSTRTSRTTIRRSFAAVPHTFAPGPLALTPTQRRIVYRTIVLGDVLLPPVAPIGPVLTAPALVPAPVATPAEAFDADVGPASANAYPTPIYPGATYAESYAPAYVGTQVPAAARLVPLPSALAGEVPVLQPYRYAVVNDRVLLVDPATNIIVADVTSD
jgi:hypothetical protein